MARPRKKLAALLKLFGTAVLLGAFVTQNSFYESSNARTNELLAAMRDRQMIDKSALLQEAMYFAALSSDGRLGDINANELAAAKASLAATKVGQSFSVAINAARAMPPEQAARVIKDMFAQAARVNDYKTLSEFFQYVDKVVTPHAMHLNVELDNERAKRERARLIYFLLYGFGSLLLLTGLFFDWRGVEE